MQFPRSLFRSASEKKKKKGGGGGGWGREGAGSV